MHIAEYATTDLKSAKAVAKLLKLKHVMVPKRIYKKIWQEARSHHGDDLVYSRFFLDPEDSDSLEVNACHD